MTVGDDFTLVGTDDEPLSAAQIDMMNEHCSIRVTSFDRLIAIGGFGRVYQVKYQKKICQHFTEDWHRKRDGNRSSNVYLGSDSCGSMQTIAPSRGR